MNTLPIAEQQADEWVHDAAATHARQWLDRCAEFRRWEKEHLLLRDPTPDLLRTHKKASRYMISTTRLVLGSVADPEYFDRALYESLEGVSTQLQAVWDMLHNHMPQTEADALLAKTFPE